jgi:hypothetical protein
MQDSVSSVTVNTAPDLRLGIVPSHGGKRRQAEQQDAARSASRYSDIQSIREVILTRSVGVARTVVREQLLRRISASSGAAVPNGGCHQYSRRFEARCAGPVGVEWFGSETALPARREHEKMANPVVGAIEQSCCP